jgi:hypothetical protein
MISLTIPHQWWVLVVTLCIVLVGATLAAEEPCPPFAAEGWDGGTPNGWVGTAGSAITVPMTGGNPGGYLRADNSGLAAAQTSDPPWIGDWGAANIARITFDFIYATADLNLPHVRVRESGSTSGWYFRVEQIGVNDGQWHHYEVPVDPSWTDQEAEAAGWTDGGAPNISFAATVASVGIVQLGATVLSGTEALGIDNFTLTTCLFSDGFESGDSTRWSTPVSRTTMQ